MQRFYERSVQIYDISKDKYYTYLSKVAGISFFKEELIPLLEKLNELGSWEAYQTYLELEKTKSELDSFREWYYELKEQYSALEEKINKTN